MTVQAHATWFEVVSVPLSSLATVTDRMSVFAKVPDTGSAWAGQASIYFVSSDVSLNWAYVGALGFSSKPHDTFFRFNLPLSTDIQQKLKGQYDDLVVRIQFNVPVGGTYVLDRLWFGQETLPSDPYSEEPIDVTLPAGLAWTDVALSVTSELRVNDRAWTREESDYSTPAPVLSLGSLTTNIGVSAEVGDLWSVPDVMLRSNAKVYGDVRTGAPTIGHQDATYTITGDQLTSYDFGPLSTLGWILNIPSEETAGPQLQPGTDLTTPLPPGSYGATYVGAGATLRLVGGTYYFRGGLAVEPNAKVLLDNSTAPVVVVVVDSFIYRGLLERQVYANPNVAVVYLGTADLALESFVNATVFAPYAHVSTAGGKTYRGALFAKSIEVHQDGHILHQPFICSDCATAEGGCGKALGCVDPDTDGDGLGDCEETTDGDDWTDPAVLGGLAVMCGGASMLCGLRGEIRPELLLGGAALAVASFIGLCLTVRCRTCGARWLWMAVRKQKHDQWWPWLMSQTACPKCGATWPPSVPGGPNSGKGDSDSLRQRS